MSAARFVLALPFRAVTFVLAAIGVVLVVIATGFEMAWRGIEG